MRVYVHDRADTGEYIDPRPVNNELRNVIGRANHLDRWAIAADIPTARFTSTAFGEFERYVKETSQAVAVPPPDYTPGSVFAPSVQVLPIPNNAGTPWVEEFVTSDGVLNVRLMLYVTSDGITNAFFRPGVQVDGRLLLGPQVHSKLLGDALMVDRVVPIGAGTVRLAPVILVYNGAPVDPAVGLATFDLTFLSRTLAVRSATR